MGIFKTLFGPSGDYKAVRAQLKELAPSDDELLRMINQAIHEAKEFGLRVYVVRCFRTLGPFFLERVLAPVCG